MPWTAPNGAQYLFAWEDGSGGGTPLDAADLNAVESDMQAFVLAVGNSLANYVDSQIAAALSSTAPTNTSSPVVSGTTQVGNTLSCTTGSWTESPNSYTYQWQRSLTASGGYATVSGATNATYLLTTGDLNYYFECVVIASNPTGSSSPVTSNASGEVIAAPGSAPVNTSVPVISGTLTVGDVLTTTTGTWNNTPTSYTYQWKRGGSNISGATSPSYTLQQADSGATLTVTVTATNAIGSASATSAATTVATAPALISSLTDAFTEGALNTTLWTATSGTPTFNLSEMVMPITSAYTKVVSNTAYTLTASSIFLEIVSPAVGNGSKQLGIQLEVTAGSQAAGCFGFLWVDTSSGEIQPYYTNSSGAQTFGTTHAVAGSTSVWLRFREATNSIFWDYSPDGITWTNIYSVAWASLGFTPNALYVDLLAGYYGTESASNGDILSLNVPATGGGGGGGGSTPTATNATNPPMGGLAVLIGTTSTVTTQTAQNCEFIVVQSWEASLATAAKASNPNVKVLMYKDSACCSNSASGDGQYDTGVSYSQANTNGWLLLNSSSQPFTLNGYSGQYAADIGLTAYQNAWATNVLNELATYSVFDGVFCDDVNSSIESLSGTKYASGNSYATAMGSWAANCVPQLTAAGKIMIGNFGSWWLSASTMNPWLQYFHGALCEMWMGYPASGGMGYQGSADAELQISLSQYAAQQNKYFFSLCQATSGDTADQTFCTAALLLGSSGTSQMLGYSNGGNYSSAIWPAVFAQAQGLGAATGALTKSGNTWSRNFANGSVSVNFTAQTATITG